MFFALLVSPPPIFYGEVRGRVWVPRGGSFVDYAFWNFLRLFNSFMVWWVGVIEQWMDGFAVITMFQDFKSGFCFDLEQVQATWCLRLKEGTGKQNMVILWT